MTVTVGLVSCEQEGPFTVHEDPANFAPFVSIDVESDLIDFTNPGSMYQFTLTAPGNNVASYDLQVTSTSLTDTVDLLTVTEFPQDVMVTFEEIATAFGAQTADFSPGDQITFLATVTDQNGREGTYSNLNSDARGPGIMQGLRHSAFIFCPFNAAEAAGTYEVLEIGFADDLPEPVATREVVAGPGENQITIVGGEYPSLGSGDLIVDIDPANGVASLGGEGTTAFSADAGAFATDNYGSVSGFVFSCVGAINLTVDFDAFAGNAHSFVLQKQ